ncbi:hypothetical protein G7046_g7260 [Stylonectria norvegica]|nr:hypothetical protein G7046_g7260 [Stylonectria norvegica]
MIEEAWRYFAPGGAITPGGPSTWHILDWDQRRIIGVTMDEEQESEDLAIEHLKKHIDNLAPGIFGIHVSQEGELLSVSTNPIDDAWLCVHYPPLDELQPSVRHVPTILRSELRERDRLGPNVDLVSYTPECTPDLPEQSRIVVFKYYFMSQFIFSRWSEMNLWMRLPPHPHIVPFDRLVLDELEGRVVGFTSIYISGGTLDKPSARPFKLKWFKQLINVIDDLNFKYGIMHQDVAARNLVVDEKTDNLMLFDFNYSARIGNFEDGGEARNDVKGVIFTIYEIITRDSHFRDLPFEQQKPAEIEQLPDWVQHPDVELDHSVAEYRSVLVEWLKGRRHGPQMVHYHDAPEYIDWPDIVYPQIESTWTDVEGNQVTRKYATMATRRYTEHEAGRKVLTWERPAQKMIQPGTVVLATGEVVAGKEGERHSSL